MPRWRSDCPGQRVPTLSKCSGGAADAFRVSRFMRSSHACRLEAYWLASHLASRPCLPAAAVRPDAALVQRPPGPAPAAAFVPAPGAPVTPQATPAAPVPTPDQAAAAAAAYAHALTVDAPPPSAPSANGPEGLGPEAAAHAAGGMQQVRLCCCFHGCVTRFRAGVAAECCHRYQSANLHALSLDSPSPGRPAQTGRTAWVLGSKTAPHAVGGLTQVRAVAVDAAFSPVYQGAGVCHSQAVSPPAHAPSASRVEPEIASHAVGIARSVCTRKLLIPCWLPLVHAHPKTQACMR
jgi:hypothetical protein